MEIILVVPPQIKALMHDAISVLMPFKSNEFGDYPLHKPDLPPETLKVVSYDLYTTRNVIPFPSQIDPFMLRCSLYDVPSPSREDTR
jgi:hypothetical protein